MDFRFSIFDRRARLPRSTRRASFRAAGFSFTELMFAVMILGIGFIMIAALFPVGLTQSKASFDETHAASIAREAIALMQAQAVETDWTNGTLYPLQVPGSSDPTNAANTTRLAHANMIVPGDPRYAWVGLYRRLPNNGNLAHVVLFVVGRPEPFKPGNDLVVQNEVRSLEPRPVFVTAPDRETMQISSTGAGGAHNGNPFAAGPGAFVVLEQASIQSSDISVVNGSGNPLSVIPTDQQVAADALVGRVFRLGSSEGGTTYAIAPGSEITEQITYVDTSVNPNVQRTVTINRFDDAQGFVVGRNRIAANGAAGDFEGPVMDVAVYTSFVSLKSTTP